MEREKIETILQQLEDIKRRSSAYVSDDFPSIVAFLDGFNLACRILEDVPIENLAIHDDILIDHGWHPSSTAPIIEMKQRGLNTIEITKLMLEMTIQQWQRNLIAHST